MKKQFFRILIAATLLSCNDERVNDYTILAGKIKNAAIDKVTISDFKRTFNKDIPLDNDGVFLDTIRDKTGLLSLSDGENSLIIYAGNGNDLKIAFDKNNFDSSLSITGKGAEICKYYNLKKQNENEFNKNKGEVFKLDEGGFKAKNQQLRNILTELINESSGIPEDFKKKERRNIHYAYLTGLRKYADYHGAVIGDRSFRVSDCFGIELDSLAYDNEEDFLFSDKYSYLVRRHYEKQAAKLSRKDSLERGIASLKVLSAIPSDIIRNELLFYTANYLGFSHTKDVETFYSLFMSASTNEQHRNEITEMYNNFKNLAKGKPSPKFYNYENHVGGVSSLDDFKGKFVYIDLWATWCGPCKAEIPYLKELEKKYHGKDIVFVSISLDNKKGYSVWKRMVVDKELRGVQLIADNSFDSQFVKAYLMQGIPRFILIDPDGSIFDPDAPRPSDPKLKDLFAELGL